MSIQPISFCINTARNELNHLKLLFKSLQYNLTTTTHEVIVFVDSDNQGTTKWLKTQKQIFPNLKILVNTLPICYGYARNINEMFEVATNDIVSYLQSDMVVCKDYDVEILKNLTANTIVCSTRIEPPLHGNSGEKLTYDFGLDPLNFNLEQFTTTAESLKQTRTTEYFFAPFTMYKDTWLQVGGHDTMFRRSREDSDVLNRLLLNGTTILQTWQALVYHFTCVSSRGINWHDPSNTAAQQRALLQQQADGVEFARYLKRWGKFRHIVIKPKYYQVVGSIKNPGRDLDKFLFVEQFFNKVYIEDPNIVKTVQDVYDKHHLIANELLNISTDTWETFKYMYNLEKAEDRIKTGQAIGDVVVEFDLSLITAEELGQLLPNLQEVLDTAEEGSFTYGNFTIHINQLKDRASETIKITNPKVKPEHLYTIL